jgi:hypothetical protein
MMDVRKLNVLVQEILQFYVSWIWQHLSKKSTHNYIENNNVVFNYRYGSSLYGL